MKLNKEISKIAVGAIFAGLILTGFAGAKEKQNSLRQVWQSVVKESDQLPVWAQELDGVITPVGSLKDASQKYHILSVCQVNTCKDRFLQLAVDKEIKHAWGVYVKTGVKPTYQWINNPPQDVKQTLQQQAEYNVKEKTK